MILSFLSLSLTSSIVFLALSFLVDCIGLVCRWRWGIPTTTRLRLRPNGHLSLVTATATNGSRETTIDDRSDSLLCDGIAISGTKLSETKWLVSLSSRWRWWRRRDRGKIGDGATNLFSGFVGFCCRFGRIAMVSGAELCWLRRGLGFLQRRDNVTISDAELH